MRKFMAFLWREEVPQIVLTTLLFVGFVTSGAVLFGPLYLTPEGAAQHYLSDPTGMRDLLFAVMPPVIAAPVVGIGWTLWKLWRPSPV